MVLTQAGGSPPRGAAVGQPAPTGFPQPARLCLIVLDSVACGVRSNESRGMVLALTHLLLGAARGRSRS